MAKEQVYVPLNSALKRRLDYSAHQLGIPASNLACELLSQQLMKGEVTIKIPKSIPASTDQDIERDAKEFLRGHHGKKHHLLRNSFTFTCRVYPCRCS